MAKPRGEKRSSRRIKTLGGASVKTGNGLGINAEAELRDVSMQGVYLFLQNRVEEESSLEVVLPLPQGIMAGHENWIRCKCRVVRVEGNGSPQFDVAATIEDFEPLDTSKLPQA